MPPETTQVQPAWLAQTPARQGRYLLGPLLGQGGMGEVREAWDVVLRRTVALKVIRTLDPVSLIRFMHEGQLQARVIHPNVCRVYDVEHADGAPRITMQLVPGGATLADLAHRLTVDDLLDVFAQVADGVHAAHRQKLIHRDLKPSNILLEPRPEGGWTPYVCDFGLAMALEEPALTCSHGVKGTPAYMAPEQIRGDRHLVGPATDVYALGGSLFFSLYGQIPAGACLDVHALLGQRRGAILLPRCPKQDLPRDLERLLQRCLEPDPDQRFQSMATLAQELRRIQRGEPTRTWPQPGRSRRTAALGVLAAAGLALALGVIQHQRQALARAERRSALARSFALEAAELEADLDLEKLLPVHDLRPAYSRAAQRLAALQARIVNLGPEAQGPGQAAVGRVRLLLGDYPGARQALAQAWSQGDRGPDVAQALAMTGVATGGEAGGTPGPQGVRTFEALAGQTREDPPEAFDRGLLAYAQGDYARAAAAAQASFVDHPWRTAAATLEGLSWVALGEQEARAGDAAGAERRFRQALATTDRQLTLARSDPGLHHVYLMAGRALARTQWIRGALTPASLTPLQRRAEEALRLDPDRPDLQAERLDLTLLQAVCLADRGQDPAPALATAQTFLAAWVRGPGTPPLRTGPALLQWARTALRQASTGGGPVGRPIALGPDGFRPATILF